MCINSWSEIGTKSEEDGPLFRTTNGAGKNYYSIPRLLVVSRVRLRDVDNNLLTIDVKGIGKIEIN
jgi:hypothetical protein